MRTKRKQTKLMLKLRLLLVSPDALVHASRLVFPGLETGDARADSGIAALVGVPAEAESAHDSWCAGQFLVPRSAPRFGARA